MIKHTRILSIIVLSTMISCSGVPGKFVEKDQLPPIFPDITGITVPVNIAPLNFRFNGDIDNVTVVLSGNNKKLEVKGQKKIVIPATGWHNLLSENSDDSISVNVYAGKDDLWTGYKPFSIYVKKEPIDQYLIYRLIAPGYESWSEMGIFQRDLTSFKESPIINNRLLTGNCMNCHSFNKTDPSQMMFHLRGNIGATMLVKDGVAVKLDTKVKETLSNCVYPYWHPSGSYITFSVNLISQVFHTISTKRIEVMDSKSDLVVYDIKANKLLTSKLISSDQSFETFPAFLPDGKTLVFCSAKEKKLPEEFDQVKYSLCKISFDPATCSFGTTIDTLVSSIATGKSISFPRPSYDGRYIMFTMSDYGNFSIWHREADLYILDLSTGVIRKMVNANSDNTESYHSWSSGSHWFVFSSRRIDGLYTRPYLSWIDENGKETKPFLLPQRDPDYYDNSLMSFNVPELVKGKVNMTGTNLLKVINSPAKKVGFEVK